HAMNITDVDDKIIRNSAHEGVSVKQYTAKYEKAFLEDSATLNIEHPILTRATDHILQMAEFIAKLEQKGFAYRTEDGSYYFRIMKMKLRNPRRSQGSLLRTSGFTCGFFSSKARRCPRARGISLPSATWCSRAISLRPFDCCSARFLIVTSLTLLLMD